jgi:enoyl-CoA hydratase
MTAGYSEYETLCLNRADGVLTIEINGAGPLNLIDGTLHRELSEVWCEVRLDSETGAVVLTGDGERAFSAGGQMEWFAGMTAADKDRAIAEGRRTIVDMLEVPQPIVAAVNGPAIGLGATLALFCDIVVASERAVIADPHVILGMVAGDGGAIIWPYLVGINRAKEFLMTGERIGAKRALQIGLVNHMVAAAELDEFAHGLARRLAGAPRMAVQGTKASINKLLREAVNLALDTSLSLERSTLDSEEHESAVQRFLAEAGARR